MAKLIRERFEGEANPFATGFVSCIDDDERLVSHDIAGSRAHAKMLQASGLLSPTECARILRALNRIEKEVAAGKRTLAEELEDVHMNVEQWVTELAGKAGAKIHTARSRNDQVALDMRLYVAEQTRALIAQLEDLRDTIVWKAARHRDVILPGYTHLQRAQPVLLSHVLLSFHDAIVRDEARLTDSLGRTEVSPLGACALAGTSLPTRPKVSAKELGLPKIFTNSIDAVSDRDFAVEFVFACALLQTHLSQVAENLILWSSAEFDFIELPDALCTSSSIMPQKKNPDMIELVRGKAGGVTGGLVNLLTTLKALPIGYNRDLQETKGPVFEAADSVRASVTAITLAMRHMNVHEEVMRIAAADPELLATDIAERLVREGVPFRDAHGQVARAMKEGAAAVDALLTPESSVRSRVSPGGTGNRRVHRRLAQLSRS